MKEEWRVNILIVKNMPWRCLVQVEEMGEVGDKIPLEEDVEEDKIKNQCSVTSVTNMATT
jgi:hypothetical protein